MRLVPISLRVDTWFVCFKRRSPTWFFQTFVPGRYKHVAAYGWVPGQDLFVFFEAAINNVALCVAPSNACAPLQDAMLRDATVVEFKADHAARRFWQPVMTCTSAVAQIIGTKSRALRPGRLLADLLAEGGEIILEAPSGKSSEPAAAAGGPGD